MTLPRPTVRAGVPGLLCIGAPVEHAEGWFGTVVSLSDSGKTAWVAQGSGTIGHPYHADDLSLDLSVSTGRLLATQWLARQGPGGAAVLDVTVHAYVAPLLPSGCSVWVEFVRGNPRDNTGVIEVCAWDNDDAPPLGAIYGAMWDEALPDGSPWYVAQALKLLIEHLASQEPA